MTLIYIQYANNVTKITNGATNILNLFCNRF
jgi:hypothetical protein